MGKLLLISVLILTPIIAFAIDPIKDQVRACVHENMGDHSCLDLAVAHDMKDVYFTSVQSELNTYENNTTTLRFILFFVIFGAIVWIALWAVDKYGEK